MNRYSTQRRASRKSRTKKTTKLSTVMMKSAALVTARFSMKIAENFGVLLWQRERETNEGDAENECKDGKEGILIVWINRAIRVCWSSLKLKILWG